jgi:hypothetical protein
MARARDLSTKTTRGEPLILEESEMKIVEGRFFGKITPSPDPASGKTFFLYSIGKLKNNEIFFNGAAGDEEEAVQTVKAHLTMLARATKRRMASTGRA